MTYLKLHLFLFLLLFCIKISKAQDDLMNVPYHDLINKAEEEITDRNYQKALNLYSEAFKENVFFAQDLYNAALCGIMIKDFNSTLKCCEGLAKRGCTLKFFSTNRFLVFRESAQWTAFLEKYPYLQKEYEAIINKNLISEIEKLNDIDQGNYRLLPDNVHNQAFQDSLKNLSDYVKLKLIRIFNKYGYLDETITGATIEQDTTLGILPIFAILIRHRYQVDKYDYTPYLKNEFNKGKIKPEVLASWIDLETKGTIGSVPALIYNCQLYFKKFPGFRETVVNNRMKYSLPTLEVARKKTIFKKCNQNNFLFFTPTGKISGIDEYTKKVLINSSDLYEQSVLNCL